MTHVTHRPEIRESETALIITMIIIPEPLLSYGLL